MNVEKGEFSHCISCGIVFGRGQNSNNFFFLKISTITDGNFAVSRYTHALISIIYEINAKNIGFRRDWAVNIVELCGQCFIII